MSPERATFGRHVTAARCPGSFDAVRGVAAKGPPLPRRMAPHSFHISTEYKQTICSIVCPRLTFVPFLPKNGDDEMQREARAIRGKGRVKRSKVPVPGRCSQTHRGGGPSKRRLVAQSAEPEDPAPALPPVQSHGRGVQLRRGVQEPRPECRHQGPPCPDDGFAGLVARGLRPLRAVLHPHGVAQRRHVPHRRRSRRRGLRRAALRAPQQLAGQRATSTRRAACSGRSSRSTAARSPGPT